MPTMPGMATFQGAGGYQRAEQGEASTSHLSMYRG